MQWDLSVLYSGFDDPALEADFLRAEKAVQEQEAFFRGLSHDRSTVQQVEAAQDKLEELYALMANLGEFLFLTLAVDSTNADAMSRMDRLMKVENQFSQLSSALSRYLGTVDDLEEAIAASPKLARYAFVLREMRDDAAHQYPPDLEPLILQMQMTGGNAWSQLRDVLDGTMKVPMTFRGEEKTLALSEVRNMAYSPDAEVRKAAYEAELAAYPAVENAMAACLNGLKGETLTLLPYRKYGSVLESVLDASRMKKETLDALWTAIREYAPMFQRYLKAKAKYLGHTNGLPFYDLFAPLERGESRRFSLEEARRYLVDVMRRNFSDKMADFIDNAFQENWIDSDPHPGKQGGAFCADLHDKKQSRILSNFDGSLSDVLTLAHELGHGYHNLCKQDLSPFNAHPPMPLAETASIFNETLVGNAALQNANEEEAFSLLESSLQETTQTCIDILSRFLFESRFIEARKTHSLSVTEIKSLMIEAQKEAYGEGLDPDILHPFMWACKSHYYRTDIHFYNFPYAFGNLFGLGVYAQFERKGKEFLPEYDALLEASGMDTVENVALRMGIDVTDPDFWRSSLAVVAKKADRFCALAEKLGPKA